MKYSVRLLFLFSLLFWSACRETPPPPVDCSVSTLAISLDNTEDTPCNVANGSIVVSATGGLAPYQFSLNSGTFQDNNSFSQLNAGFYRVTVTDTAGCTDEVEAQLASGTVLADIANIISTSCAVTECHDGSTTGRPNYTIEQQILDNVVAIGSVVEDGSMPPANSGVSITESQKKLILCWVNDGGVK